MSGDGCASDSDPSAEVDGASSSSQWLTSVTSEELRSPCGASSSDTTNWYSLLKNPACNGVNSVVATLGSRSVWLRYILRGYAETGVWRSDS